MKNTVPLQFLHVSDFHVGKESYPQLSMFSQILNKLKEHVKQKKVPDLVFISGDVANTAKNEEYETFLNKFISPMLDIFGSKWGGEIYSVPGNHDVDRNSAEAVQKHGILSKIPSFLDPDDVGFSKRKPLFPRFETYFKNDPSTRIDCNWIFSKEGVYTDIISKRGIKIGIVGINTAWLSENDQDRNNLSPGYNLIYKGVQEIINADVKIVLGHHPISWFRDQDVSSISNIFAKNDIIYLHGHLHEPGACYIDGGGHFFRSVQTGACFQVRQEDKILNNYLLLGEISYPSTCISLQPFHWSHNQNTWVLYNTAFAESYFKKDKLAWELPDKIIDKSHSELSAKKPKLEIKLPNGWLNIDSEFLSERTRELKEEEVLAYFDGVSPTWKHALYRGIPHRKKVAELYECIASLDELKENHIFLLLGAGGEGKSTIIRQVICELVINNVCNVLWHNDTESSLPPNFFKYLPIDNKPWVIASDDADIILNDLFNASKELNASQHPGIHFLLCSRLNDWIASKGPHKPWHKYVSLNRIELRGLSIEDSKVIVESWQKYGDRGLGKLHGLGLDAAIERLKKEAESELYPQDGAFLGAMLRARYGSALKDHVLELLKRIEKRVSPGGTLLKAFSYIAALHAENKQILSKIVLAGILGCAPGDVFKKVLGPLGDEAAAAKTGKFILCRHRAIAEASMELLADVFHEDTDDLYIEIVQTAQRVRSEGDYVFSLGEYADLPDYFYDKGHEELGLRMAMAQLEVNNKNPFLITRLSNLYRKANLPLKSVETFRKAPNDVERTRAFYYEWGTAEWLSGHQAFAAYLDFISLADNTEKAPPDNERTKTSLRGVCGSLKELYERYYDKQFIFGYHAAAKLGLSLKIDRNDLDYFSSVCDKTSEIGIKENDPKTLFEYLKQTVSNIWMIIEVEPAAYIEPPNKLTFRGLSYVLKLSDIVS